MKRGIIAASVHGHTVKILIIFRKNNNSCLVLFAKIQNFSAYLMCIMLVQVFITHVIFFIWLIHVVFIRKNFGCFYFFQQCFAVITICISSVTVFHTDWSEPFIQHTAYRKTIRICNAHHILCSLLSSVLLQSWHPNFPASQEHATSAIFPREPESVKVTPNLPEKSVL